MASCARSRLFQPGAEGVFHCWSRCVRGARLCGRDPVTGKNCDHRRQWVVERMDVLCQAFAIDVLFFAILGTHLHHTLRSLPRLVKRMGDWEVARRWLTAFPGHRVLEGPPPAPSEEKVSALAKDKKRIKVIRRRLSDVSWFFRALKEPIARRANAEDETRGPYFAGRYGCRLVEGDEATLGTGIYNDLNLLRAGMSATPFDSPYCSSGLRFRAAAGGEPTPWLAELTLASGQSDETVSGTKRRATDKGCLDMTWEQYAKVLTWAATLPVAGKASMSQELAELLERQGLRPDSLGEFLERLPRVFRRAIGVAVALTERAAAVGQRWFQGVGQAAKYFTR